MTKDSSGRTESRIKFREERAFPFQTTDDGEKVLERLVIYSGRSSQLHSSGSDGPAVVPRETKVKSDVEAPYESDLNAL
jgi:hypothetical protein